MCEQLPDWFRRSWFAPLRSGSSTLFQRGSRQPQVLRICRWLRTYQSSEGVSSVISGISGTPSGTSMPSFSLYWVVRISAQRLLQFEENILIEAPCECSAEANRSDHEYPGSPGLEKSQQPRVPQLSQDSLSELLRLRSTANQHEHDLGAPNRWSHHGDVLGQVRSEYIAGHVRNGRLPKLGVCAVGVRLESAGPQLLLYRLRVGAKKLFERNEGGSRHGQRITLSRTGCENRCGYAYQQPS